jgi:hypothetical protein
VSLVSVSSSSLCHDCVGDEMKEGVAKEAARGKREQNLEKGSQDKLEKTASTVNGEGKKKNLYILCTIFS